MIISPCAYKFARSYVCVFLPSEFYLGAHNEVEMFPESTLLFSASYIMVEVTPNSGSNRESQLSLEMGAYLRPAEAMGKAEIRGHGEQSPCPSRQCLYHCPLFLEDRGPQGWMGRLYAQKHLGLNLRSASCLMWVLEKFFSDEPQ